ncbi:uncharacterized protein LOC143598130 [Bidens hawaiensis]|uniref:uncharacterized protein LOC143598130 n=1 Tax=Bidens hawaiensis TaxID=980011 RepID=UPI004049A0F3
MKLHANKKRQDAQLLAGEWVYVKLKPYRQLSFASRIHQKLAAKFFGPFQILEKIGPVAYKLILHATFKIRQVFHVSLLKKAVSRLSETELPPELDMSDSLHPLPHSVLAIRVIREGSDSLEQWLVHWKGQPVDEASWEDADWIKLQYPEFNLEDKTVLEGEGSDKNHEGPKELIVYSRRGKLQSG